MYYDRVVSAAAVLASSALPELVDEKISARQMNDVLYDLIEQEVIILCCPKLRPDCLKTQPNIV